MNKYLFSIFVLLTLSLKVIAAPQLRPGDILLQPLKCWACALIEAEEETIYSHMGIVLSVHPQVVIAEALGSVRKVSLTEFLSRTEKGQKTKLIRFQNSNLSAYFQKNSLALTTLFNENFDGSAYDPQFLWNNFDPLGREKLYCSEMISKLIQYFVRIETPIKRMHFQKNRDHWTTYFSGNVPDDMWGNSPADFDRSELFYAVGEL